MEGITVGKFQIKRPERVVDLCLDADLQAEWEQADAALTKARNNPPGDRLVGNAEAAEWARKVTDIQDRMAGSVLHFRLRAMPRSQWVSTLARHPAGDNPGDRAFGASKESFFAEVIPASIVEVKQGDEVVEFDTAEDWPGLADDMTDAQYDGFATAVLELNRTEVSVPFSRAASRTMRDSSKTSA